jgi:translation initiation factor IF-3
LQVRLIAADGENVGVVPLAEAKRQALENALDLVEIVPNADPPVVRVMDVGKFLFEQNKKRHAAKRKQKQVQIKEIKLRPGTDDGDYDIKMRNIKRFLEEGDKVKITLRFRGREMAHQELGAKMLDRVEADLDGLAVIEQYARMEGRQMVMLVGPKRH